MGPENRYEFVFYLKDGEWKKLEKIMAPIISYDDFTGLRNLAEMLTVKNDGKLTINEETIYLDDKPLCEISHIHEMSIQHFPLGAHLHATIECAITYIDPRVIAAKSVKDELKSRDMGLDKYSRMKRDET